MGSPNPESEKDPTVLSNPHLNFSTLINMPGFFIARGAAPGKGLKELTKELQVHAPPELDTIVYMNKYGYNDKLTGYFKSLAASLTSAITGKAHYSRGFNFAKDQAKIAQELGIHFHHPAVGDHVYIEGKSPTGLHQPSYLFPTKKTFSKDLSFIGDEESFYVTLRKILTAEGPVLFHCKGGIHRTGMMALLIRYLEDPSWSQPFAHGPVKVTVERKNALGTPFQADLHNQAELEYASFNPKNFREENLVTTRALAQTPLFLCLQEKFMPYLSGKNETILTPTNKHQFFEECWEKAEPTLASKLTFNALRGKILLLEKDSKKEKKIIPELQAIFQKEASQLVAFLENKGIDPSFVSLKKEICQFINNQLIFKTFKETLRLQETCKNNNHFLE